MSKANSCYLLMASIAIVCLYLLVPQTILAQSSPKMHLSTFKAGSGPSHAEGLYRLLDESATPGQSNAVAFEVAQPGMFEQVTLRCRFRVLAGGDGGAFILLNTTEYGTRGPAPFVKNWTEPNLTKTFAVGIDVHNPPTKEPFGTRGNYQGQPEREISLHWNGREIVKRVASTEFRGDFTDCEISVQHVIGGADITVRIAGETIYDRYFLAGMLPYESRLAIGAGTRDDATTEFDVRNIEFMTSRPAQPQRAPKNIEIFNHITINNAEASHEREITLPPLDWAYGRVILTLEINDAGPDWDTWDRSGHFYVIDSEGVKHDIVPFITSYRTPCHWEVDVTRFRPWLTGKVKFEIAIATARNDNRGFMMSASLDFYHGTPALEPYRVIPVWVGTAKYKSAANHFSDFFTAQEVDIDAETQAAQLFITTTGHTKVGEFTPSPRTVVFTPEQDGAPAAEQRFVNILWKTDCYLNPVRPQHGTWKYARAGWAPGDFVRPWLIDLTPYILPGKTAQLRYEPGPFDFSGVPEDQHPSDDEVNSAIHVVRSYLVLYRATADLMPAPTLEILDIAVDSNAAKAGLRKGDLLDSYDGKRPDSIDDLRAIIKSAEATGRRQIEIVIYRGSERMIMQIGSGQMGIHVAEELLR